VIIVFSSFPGLSGLHRKHRTRNRNSPLLCSSNRSLEGSTVGEFPPGTPDPGWQHGIPSTRQGQKVFSAPRTLLQSSQTPPATVTCVCTAAQCDQGTEDSIPGCTVPTPISQLSTLHLTPHPAMKGLGELGSLDMHLDITPYGPC